MLRPLPSILALGCLAVSPSLALAQAKRTLLPADYGQWQRLTSSHISNDGHWISYQIVTVDGGDQLVVKNSDGPERAEVAEGTAAVFSDDSKWCGFLINPPKATADKLRAENKPLESKFGLRNLANGKAIEYEGVQAFRFLKGSKTLMLSRYRGAGKAEGGSDEEIIDLATGGGVTIGNVVAAQPNEKGDLIALSIRSDSGMKGVQIYEPTTGILRTMIWGKDDTYRLTWAKKADAIAFLVGTPDEKKVGDSNVAMIVSNLRSSPPTRVVYDPTKQAAFEKGKRIAEYGGFVLNDDGTTLAFGVADWQDKKKSEGNPSDKPGVEVWNTKDVREIPEQEVEEARDKVKTALCVWRPKTGEFHRISDGKLENALLLPTSQTALVLDPTPYLSPVTNGIKYYDIYTVDTSSGHKAKVITKTQWLPVPSRTGRYFAYFERKNWWLYDIQNAKKSSLTGDLKTTWEDVDDDHTVPEKPPIGQPQWLANDDGLLLEDKYDTYLVRIGSNSITPLTDGRKDHTEYRFADPFQNEDGPSLQQPFFFRALDDLTKASGFYRCDSKGSGHMLVFDNVSVSGLQKAKDVDRVVFTMGSYEMSPNLYLTNFDMKQIKPESKTNPQQANFYWGKSELITYKSRWGKDLQGSLIYPANYVKGQTYPMVVSIYEKESDSLNTYSVPDDAYPYSPQVLSQNGYFVLMPDIAYRPRDPGRSAVDCLEPAVDAVFAKRVGVDSTKVGLIGHSWGAYETAFVTTVSKYFAVGVAGAPPTELTSFYNSFYWNLGVSDQEIFETSQGRMGVPFWEDPKAYIDNSPVWQSAKRTAPILIECGDKDGAVDWHQSLYLFNTLRRMGKNAVLLVYAGENHVPAKKANLLDYSHRLRHYLDVYLKGVKPEPWVNQDVPLLQQLGE